MKKQAFIYFLVGCGIVLALAVSCTKDKTPRPGANITTPCDPNKVYFEKSVRPIINSNCAMSGCHDAATQQDGVNLSSYEGIRAQVRPGRPEDSDLIEKINESDDDERMPPPPRSPLTKEQKDILWKWVAQGADNAVCEESSAGCNPSNVSFANDIMPVFTANCTGCHGSAAPSGQINLTTHGGALPVAQNGKLYHAVAQDGQATPMPQGGGKLPACDIQKIKVWVDEGARNN